jgi:hypothetical protein
LLIANEGSLAFGFRKSAILASPHLAVSAQNPLIVLFPIRNDTPNSKHLLLTLIR